MILRDVIKGLQLHSWVIISLVDAETDKYLKGGYPEEVVKRYGDLHVVRIVVSRDGSLRFWLSND